MICACQLDCVFEGGKKLSKSSKLMFLIFLCLGSGEIDLKEMQEKYGFSYKQIYKTKKELEGFEYFGGGSIKIENKKIIFEIDKNNFLEKTCVKNTQDLCKKYTSCVKNTQNLCKNYTKKCGQYACKKSPEPAKIKASQDFSTENFPKFSNRNCRVTLEFKKKEEKLLVDQESRSYLESLNSRENKFKISSSSSPGINNIYLANSMPNQKKDDDDNFSIQKNFWLKSLPDEEKSKYIISAKKLIERIYPQFFISQLAGPMDQLKILMLVKIGIEYSIDPAKVSNELVNISKSIKDTKKLILFLHNRLYPDEKF